MATIDLRRVIQNVSESNNKLVLWEIDVDFSVKPVAATDLVILHDLKKFSFNRFDAYLLTPQGAAATFDVGIQGVSTTLFANNANANAAAGSQLANGTVTSAAGALYSGPLILTADAALSVAKIKLVFQGYRVYF
jgi:hypothetical protein